MCRTFDRRAGAGAEDAQTLGLFGFASIGQVAWVVASLASNALVGLLVGPEAAGVTLSALGIFMEPSGKAALLMFDLGMGSLWSERTLRHRADRSVHFVLRDRPDAGGG
jgi:hypothetical protein